MSDVFSVDVRPDGSFEMETRHLLVTTAGSGSALAVVVPVDGDLGQVAYEVHRLVRQVGVHLAVQNRPTTPSDGGGGEGRSV